MLPVLYMSALVAWVWFSRPRGTETNWKWLFWAGLALKLLFGAASFYFHFYVLQTGDWWKAFEKSLILTDVARTDTSEYLRILVFDRASERSLRRALSIWYVPSYFFPIKILSLQNLLTNSNLFLNSLAFTVFGFLGSWKLIRTISLKWPNQTLPVLAAFFLFPSVIFWSSGLSKETLLVGCLGYILAYVLGFKRLSEREKITQFLGVLACLYMGWQIRYFVLVALGVCLAAAWLQIFLSCKMALKNVWARAMLFLVLFAAVTVTGSLLHPNFTVHRIIELTVNSQEFIGSRSSSEAFIQYNLEPTLQSVLLNAPNALVTALYRPFVWEAQNTFLLAAALENLALLLFTLAAIYFQRRNTNSSLRPEWKLALLAYVVLTAVMIGLNTPNFGSLYRYKVTFLPALIFVLLSGGGWRPFLTGLRR